MDMKQLTTFITLAGTLNYQKAAEQLQYAPSTLFKHIQLLEQELDAQLFCKVGRQLQLTDKGRAFLEHAQAILEEYRMAIDRISCDAMQEGGLTLGGCELNTANNLLDLLAQFSRFHPSARMSMVTSPNADVPKMVRGDLIDLGFYYSIDGKNLQGLETVRLYRQPAYLMAAQDHPIHTMANVSYEDINGMPFVYPHDTCCLVTEFMEQLKGRGVHLGSVAYLGNMHLVVEQVHARRALTLVPHCAVKHFGQKHRIKPVAQVEPLVWAWNTLVYKNYDSLGRPAKALLRHSVEYAQRLLREDGTLVGEADM